MVESEDKAVVRCCLKGDKKAFEILVRKYEQPMINYFGRMVQDRELSLDLSQEVFLRAYGALHTYDEKYQFSTWLFRIATNLLIDYWRKKKIPLVYIETPGPDPDQEPVQIPDHEPSAMEKYEKRQMTELIEKAITRLPENLRELFVLRHINDFSYEEIASLKHLPVGTVKNRVFQAKELLRSMLEER